MISGYSYEQIESKQGIGYNRKCIDGKITGCGKCVGYCKCSVHPGFLTEKLRKEHDCLEKSCFHYIPKLPHTRPLNRKKALLNDILGLAKQRISDLEGMRIISVQEQGINRWQFNYITISNEYPIHDIEQALGKDLNAEVSFIKLDYSFDRCVALIIAE